MAVPGRRAVTVEGGQTSALVEGLDDHRRRTFTVTALSPVGEGGVDALGPGLAGRRRPLLPFPLQLLYVLVLVAAAFARALAGTVAARDAPWLAEPVRIRVLLPQGFAGVALSIAWFGALGAVMISLGGIFDHGHRDWRRGCVAWDISRPLLGAVMAMVGFMVLSGTPRAAGPPLDFSTAGTGRLILYAVAFVIGFREAVFRTLVKRLARVIIPPGLGGV